MKRYFLIALSAGVLSGCASTSVKLDYDKSADFSGLKKFAWENATQPTTGDPRIDNDLSDERVRNAVDSILVSKGFVFAAQDDADFLVAYFVDFKRSLSSSSASVGVGRSSHGRYGGVSYGGSVSETEQGLLTIDIIDPADQKTIWRGVGTGSTYSGSNPDKATQKINDSVASILRKFPPEK